MFLEKHAPTQTADYTQANIDILESGRILGYFTINYYFLLITLSSTFFSPQIKQNKPHANCLNKILFWFLPKY